MTEAQGTRRLVVAPSEKDSAATMSFDTELIAVLWCYCSGPDERTCRTYVRVS